MLAACAVLLACATADAARAAVLKPAADQIRRDALALVTVERRPQPRAVAFSLAGLAVLAAGDRRLTTTAERRLPDGLDRLEPLGRVGAANAVGAALLTWGLVGGQRRAVVAGVTVFEGNLALGVVLNAAKAGFGRARPHEPRAGRLRQGGESLPSSHAAHAFLIAAVLDATCQRRSVAYAAYGLAGGIALSRLQAGLHFPTDVVVGGGLGWWIGHRLSVSHGLDRARGQADVTLVPTAGGMALRLSWSR